MNIIQEDTETKQIPPTSLPGYTSFYRTAHGEYTGILENSDASWKRRRGIHTDQSENVWKPER